LEHGNTFYANKFYKIVLIIDKIILGTFFRNLTSGHSHFVYQFNIGRWSESDSGPALSGVDLDDINNHLYFTFNRSIYRLDLSQEAPSEMLIGTYDNLVFNPRFSASRNSLFFCIRNEYQEKGKINIKITTSEYTYTFKGDLVQVSLSDPLTLTTLVYNTSTGSIVQQLFIDDDKNTLYYNSPGTLTMRGVSLTPPYNQVFSSIYLNVNPAFFDFSPYLNTFVFGDLKFSGTFKWSPGPDQPTRIYTSATSTARTTGVKFFNDTHVIVAHQYAGQGLIAFININNINDTTVPIRSLGMGTSLIFDEKYCNFYYAANSRNYTVSYLDQLILRKNIKEDFVTVYQKQHMVGSNSIFSLAFDVSRRNLVVSRASKQFNISCAHKVRLTSCSGWDEYNQLLPYW